MSTMGEVQTNNSFHLLTYRGSLTSGSPITKPFTVVNVSKSIGACVYRTGTQCKKTLFCLSTKLCFGIFLINSYANTLSILGEIVNFVKF